MSRAPAVVAVLLLVLVAWALMYRGWQGRVRRQGDVPAPAPVPAALALRTADQGFAVTYVSTTTAADWLDRLAVHQLGTRCSGQLLVDPAGVVLVRVGQQDLFVPAKDLRDVRRETMRAGKARPGTGLLVWDWMLGEALVSTAVHVRREAEAVAAQGQLRNLLAELTEQTGQTGQDDESQSPLEES